MEQTTSATMQYFIRKPDRLGDTVCVELIGDLDLVSVKQVSEPIQEAVADVIRGPETSTLTIDLQNVEFIDSAGLMVLLTAHKQLHDCGRSISIILAERSQPQRVLRLGRFESIMKTVMVPSHSER